MVLAAAAACGKGGRSGPPAPPPAPVAAPPPDAGPVDPNAAEAAATAKKVVAVFRCLDDDLRARAQKTLDFVAYRRNVFTELYVFDFLFGAPDRLKAPEAELCAQAGREYRKHFLPVAAVRARGNRAGTPAAMPPAVDAEPEFVRAAGGPSALHLLDHAEITRAALRELTGGRLRPAFEAVVGAAVQTAILRFNETLINANTEDHEPAARATVVAQNEQAFVDRLAKSLVNFAGHVRNGYFANASLELAVACHAGQDLVFHRGLTRQQQAGLRFAAHRDPSGSTPAAARSEAKRVTRELLLLARATLEPAQWQSFVDWTPPLGYDPANARRMYFHDDGALAPLGLISMLHRWSLQLGYRNSPTAQADLAEGAGLARWDVKRVLERVRQVLPPSGIALRPARP
jgi:hypothetical protein